MRGNTQNCASLVVSGRGTYDPGLGSVQKFLLEQLNSGQPWARLLFACLLLACSLACWIRPGLGVLPIPYQGSVNQIAKARLGGKIVVVGLEQLAGQGCWKEHGGCQAC